MTRISILSTSLAAAIVSLLSAAPAQALQNKTFVSSTGGGTTCTRAAPCTGFQDAHNATNAGGEINCLDSGYIGGAVIIKSITIDCAGLAATTNFIDVQGTGSVVMIRNLSIDAFGGFGGIGFEDGAALFVENCVIQNVVGPGIKFAPSASGAKLTVTDTTIIKNGSGSTGGGIVVQPNSGGTAQVVLNRVTVSNNVFGIVADGTGSTGGINMTVKDSVSSGNSQDGIIATTPAGGAPIGIFVSNTASANNGFGVRSIGPNVTVRVENSKVIGNGTGVISLNGGGLVTFGNNVVQANGANGGFTAAAGLQ